ncbi:MAG TPA: phospholipid carrier-dependent glycosyltransferase [Nitriliruptorales bacterium]
MLDRARSSPWLLPLVLTAVAAIALFVRLDEPARIVFDETYYVGDAKDYLTSGVEDSFSVHPPIGKWLIALGIALFGDDPFGWRAASALAGTLTVLLTYLMGLRLLRDRALAALAGVLLLTDGLFFVQARTSMLDIFLALFVALAAWGLLVDHDRRRLGARHDLPDDAAATIAGRYRWLAGVALGLAVATKWSGLLALGAAGSLVLGWELVARWRHDGSILARPLRLVGSMGATLVLVPALVYLASYVPWLVQYEHAKPSSSCEPAEDAPLSLADRFEGLWCYHGAVWDFHRGLDADHPYRAPAYTWPVLARPVVYDWETCKDERAAGVPTENEDGELVEPEPCVVAEGDAAEIIALGNPVLWWLFLPAVIPLLAGAVARDPRAWFLMAFWGMQFAPWLVPPMGSRPVFLFYMTPVVPFLALGMAYACRYVAERRDLVRPTLGALVAAAAALGLGFVTGTGAPDHWLWAGGAYLGGAVVASVITRRRGDLEPSPLPDRWNPGYTAAIVLGVLGIAAFVYFYPVWTGLALPEEAIRRRWWIQPGWI